MPVTQLQGMRTGSSIYVDMDISQSRRNEMQQQHHQPIAYETVCTTLNMVHPASAAAVWHDIVVKLAHAFQV